jgi:sugar/nucleoside kinase (ribokinase family)
MADVGCAGILVADTFCGPMKRLPHAGELLAIDEMPAKAGGCAANVAIDLARQGVSASICGCVGADASAEVLLQNLRAAGVDCDQIIRLESHPTSKTVILLVEGEDRRFVHVFGANAAFNVGMIRREWIDGLKVFYLGGLFVMPAVHANELAELLAYCRRRKIVTVVDVVVPHGHPVGIKSLEPILPHVDYFLPNEDEARQLTGFSDHQAQAEAFLSHGARTVVITCGSEGAVAASTGSKATQLWRSGVYRVQCIDPSGSGDAFAAGIIAAVLNGWDMPKALRLASALGASATTAVGTTDGVFTREQAEAFLKENPLSVEHSHGAAGQ